MESFADRDHMSDWLAQYLHAWARHNIFFGVSCAQAKMESYLRCGSTVCGNVDTRQGTTALQMQRPLWQGCRLALAVANDSLVYRFPHGHPDPLKRGALNTHFLDAAVLQEHFFPSLQPVAPQVGMVLLPVSHIYRTESLSFPVFLDRLACFLDALPPAYAYAVELHNGEYLLPEYFDRLCERRVAHVINQSPAMPAVLDQVQLPRVLSGKSAVVRVNTPEDADVQLGILEAVRRCIDARKVLSVYFGDQTESSASVSLMTLMERLNPDLARLSIIKKQAA
jgi:hypothetical protein